MSTTSHNHLDEIVAREHRQRVRTEAFVLCLGISIALLAVLFG